MESAAFKYTSPKQQRQPLPSLLYLQYPSSTVWLNIRFIRTQSAIAIRIHYVHTSPVHVFLAREGKQKWPSIRREESSVKLIRDDYCICIMQPLVTRKLGSPKMCWNRVGNSIIGFSIESILFWNKKIDSIFKRSNLSRRQVKSVKSMAPKKTCLHLLCCIMYKYILLLKINWICFFLQKAETHSKSAAFNCILVDQSD